MVRAYFLLTVSVLTSVLMGQAKPTHTKPIEVHGHRGARAMRPENTLPAFDYAIAQGVDVLELDMAVTKDGLLVVSHDPFLSKPICSGPPDKAAIHELTLSEVRQWDCGATSDPQLE